jgi:hypothetical protein
MAKFTQLQKIMLVNAHPVKNLLNLIGATLGLYYLWQNQVINALIFGFGLILVGTVLATGFGKFNPEKIASTFWGKIFLCYTNGVTFFLYIAAHILIPYGFWIHNLYVSLIGVLMLLAGLLIYHRVLH